ncbi:MAG: GMC family oxidoreductase [Myxococcales bacterium]|nr:GMC family oxidoreductase [Myxococcales bacterium]
MKLDARTFEAGRTLEADVVIVGGGAAGISIARELAGGPLRVCLLESGGDTFEAASHALLRGVNAGAPYFPLDSCRLRYLGGTTNHWSGASWPLEPIDFESRPGIPHSGWPLSRADLDPFYRRAHRVCQLGPFDYGLERWRGEDGDAPWPLGEGAAVTKLMQSSPPTRFGHEYGEELFAAENVTVCLHATALELETGRRGSRVEAVRVGVLDGVDFRVEGKRFVLASGGIDNPRLLLLSPGIANPHDQIGRYFTEHLMLPCGFLLPSDPEIPLGFYTTHVVDGTQARGVLGLAAEVLRDEGLLNFSANLKPWLAQKGLLERKLGRLGRPVRRLASRLSGPRDLLGVQLESHAEQAPNPDSRVTLATEKDAFGLPRARLDWRLSALDKRSLRRSTELLGEALGAAGLGRVRSLIEGPDDEWARWQGRSAWTGPTGAFHHMGATRMHEDPRQGVVDPDCRVHGVDNLFVAGSSVFPTSGYANPTLTLVALALRLADHLSGATG